jgi:hypothetical protein
MKIDIRARAVLSLSVLIVLLGSLLFLVRPGNRAAEEGLSVADGSVSDVQVEAKPDVSEGLERSDGSSSVDTSSIASAAAPDSTNSVNSINKTADAALAEYERFGVESEGHRNWLIRNRYPDDAHVALLLAMDINSLRALVAKGDLAAQTELAYRLSRETATQGEALELFTDAALKGSKEALARVADSVEHGGLCSNAVVVNAHLHVAAMLGDLSVMPKFVQCSNGLSPQDHGFSLVLAARMFSELNKRSIARTGRPLTIDLHPLTNEAIKSFVEAGKSEGKNGG